LNKGKEKMKKHSHIIKTLVLVPFTFSLLTTGLVAAERGGGSNMPGPLYRMDTGNFDGNRIYDDLENNGMIVSHRISGHSGMEWPKDTHLYINYASGIWVAGKVGGDIRTAVGEYGPEFVSGPWGGDASSSDHKLYKVNKSDLANPLASDDFQNWPADLGAPWVDNDGDGVYTPMPAGADHPEFIGDQVIWWVMNDGDLAQHSIFNTLPVGIEMQVTIWGYNRPDAFGDMMFVKALIINKGGSDVTETIIGLWSDPDLGYAGDDFVGCDTTLSLGYCYNDGADADYGTAAPAIGYDFFQGPIVPSVGDTAFALGRSIPDFKNLGMSSFTKYINGDPVYADPNDAIEAYNYMSGYLRNGQPYINSATGEPGMFVHPDDPNDNTDANDDVWVDSDDHASGDRRFLMNAGPFTLKARSDVDEDNGAGLDSQEVVFGILIAQGADHLSSVTLLKQIDVLAQTAYDVQFALPPAPQPPVVTYSTQAHEINLMWDNAQESYTADDDIDKQPLAGATTEVWETQAFADITSTSTIRYVMVDTTANSYDTLAVYNPDMIYPHPVIIAGVSVEYDTTYYMEEVLVETITEYTDIATEYKFEGYNIWQFNNATGFGSKKLVATFDKINDIMEIQDEVFDAARGENVLVTVQHGSDSGVRNHFTITKDYLGGGIPLKTNRAYYFAVTAYGYNEYGIPKTLEGAPDVLTIRPAISTEYDVNAVGEENLSDEDGELEHTSGVSDGSVEVLVVDPFQVTGHDYEVEFYNQLYYKDSLDVWQLDTGSGKIMDVTGSHILATASEQADGTIDIDLTFKMVSSTGAWVDGIIVALPADIVINNATDVVCNGGPIDDASATIDGQIVSWGLPSGTYTEWGCFAGNEELTINVASFDPPITLAWEIYDDAYGVTDDDGVYHPELIMDAYGITEINSISEIYVWSYGTAERQTLVLWKLTDVETNSVRAERQTVVGGVDLLTGDTYGDGDDAGWLFVDGLKLRVSGAPFHALKSDPTWDESGGTISPAFSFVETFVDANSNLSYDHAESYDDIGVDNLADAFEAGYVGKDKENLDPSEDNFSLQSCSDGESGTKTDCEANNYCVEDETAADEAACVSGGSCSDATQVTETDCLNGGLCSFDQFDNESECAAYGECSNCSTTLTTQAECVDAGYAWTAGAWSTTSCSDSQYDNVVDCESNFSCTDHLEITSQTDCEAAGTCTDAQYTNQSDCEAAAVCSDSQHTNETDCLAPGICTDNASETLAACEDNGYHWISVNQWSSNAWTSYVWEINVWGPVNTWTSNSWLAYVWDGGNPLLSEGNGVWDSYPNPEPYDDVDSSESYTLGVDTFDDYGTDGFRDANEPGYTVAYTDPAGDNYDADSNPEGTEGNLQYDVGEGFDDADNNSSWTDAEEWTDTNCNGAFDAGYPADGNWMNWSWIGPFTNWWGGGTTIAGNAYVKVELRFVEMQSYEDANGDGVYSNGDPYTWNMDDPNSGYADMYLTWGPGNYTGWNPVPYSAWNMDTTPATQLHTVQRDRDNNGRWDGVRSGNYNYIWITSVPFTGESYFDGSSDEKDWMTAIDGAGAPAYYTADLDITNITNMLARSGVITFVPARDNLPGETFRFSTKGALAKSFNVNEIKVWPNPYFGYNPEERTPLERMMQFTHLPNENCTIRIFNLAGELVRKIKHDNGTQYEVWDLTNNFNIPVASGMYIAHIETDYGDKILKLAVVQPEERIDVY
jgi:hypothetical protein